MHSILRAVAVVLIVGGTVVAGRPPEDAKAQDLRPTRFTLPASGVSLDVPLGVFEAMPVDTDAQGQLFVGRDDGAQLLLGAFRNVDGRSVAEHQRFVIRSNYANAEIDYAPVRRSWFVVSGTLDKRTFYQRVTFTCGGRLISSWAMIYPTSRKRFYDNIVERIHKSFRVGRGPQGGCRLASLDE